MKLADLDHPFIFILAITMSVMALTYVAGWGFSALGWDGPAQLARGYRA